jgi:hypothetical protein
MIGVFVTFTYGNDFDEQAVRKVAETSNEARCVRREYCARTARSHEEWTAA